MEKLLGKMKACVWKCYGLGKYANEEEMNAVANETKKKTARCKKRENKQL